LRKTQAGNERQAEGNQGEVKLHAEISSARQGEAIVSGRGEKMKALAATPYSIGAAGRDVAELRLYE
jgi:hypothetical protein